MTFNARKQGKGLPFWEGNRLSSWIDPVTEKLKQKNLEKICRVLIKSIDDLVRHKQSLGQNKYELSLSTAVSFNPRILDESIQPEP